MTEREDACPVWCVTEHQRHDHPDDRHHLNLGASIPVVERRTVPTETGETAVTVGTEAHVAVSRHLDGVDVWVAIATEQRSVELSLESMIRVCRELEAVLHVVRATDHSAARS
jgi:hypothetical protein